MFPHLFKCEATNTKRFLFLPFDAFSFRPCMELSAGHYPLRSAIYFLPLICNPQTCGKSLKAAATVSAVIAKLTHGPQSASPAMTSMAKREERTIFRRLAQSVTKTFASDA